jgi:hypothetical protein
VHPILHYAAAKWDPYREEQINSLDRVQNKLAMFAHHSNDWNWETLAERRKIARICALFKVYMGQRENGVGRLQVINQRPYHLNRVDYDKKIKSKKKRTDIGNIRLQV